MELYQHLIDHWPFVAVACVLSICGDFFGKSVFTRERAYAFRGNTLWHRAAHAFWYWGRETLPLHPMAAGFCLGRWWPDPEGKGWGVVASSWYFAFAGFASLVVWIVLKAYAKHKNIALELPGDSVPPKGGDDHGATD